MSHNLQKLYAYVDESGQDTRGAIFLVSVVIVENQREELRQLLRKIEKQSGKANRKWARTARSRRRKYIFQVIHAKKFSGLMYFSHHYQSRNYMPMAILTTAWAVLEHANPLYQATVFVDGLNQTQRKQFTRGLRQLHIKTRLVHGLKDENDEFIRLADAIAGFVRDGLEGDDVMKPLFKKALRRKVIISKD